MEWMGGFFGLTSTLLVRLNHNKLKKKKKKRKRRERRERRAFGKKKGRQIRFHYFLLVQFTRSLLLRIHDK
jgi:hypothetical protein